MTLQTQLVLQAMINNGVDEEQYGLEICENAELPPGSIYPILARLERVGWLVSRWEDIDPHEHGRPRRRYYRLTSDGAQRSYAALAKARARTSLLTHLSPNLAPGGNA